MQSFIREVDEHGLIGPQHPDANLPSDQDIDALIADQPDCAPPGLYIEFMKEQRYFSGPFDFPVDTSYAMGLKSRETAEDLREHYPEFELSGKFFFSEHEGYIVWYFKPSDPGVYRFGEDTEEEIAVSDSFADFLCTQLRLSLKIKKDLRMG